MGQNGFTIEACSSGGGGCNFSRRRRTEGDPWLAKSKNKVAGWSANKALIEAIERRFAKMKKFKVRCRRFRHAGI